jgi:ABC-type glutathione transport system ATPase component
LLRLLPESSRVEGDIRFEGTSLLSLSDKPLRAVRGNRIAIVHQDSSVLNPVRRAGDQLVDVLRAHRPWSYQHCREKALSLLEEMALEPAARIYSAYPHQLSGGERQRIVVAQALICSPSLIVADEPTASVDHETGIKIIRLLDSSRKACGGSTILISHDVQVLTLVADRIAVLYGGRIAELGTAEQVLNQPHHPYTRALLKCSDDTNFGRNHRISGLPLPTITEPLGMPSTVTWNSSFRAASDLRGGSGDRPVAEHNGTHADRLAL